MKNTFKITYDVTKVKNTHELISKLEEFELIKQKLSIFGINFKLKFEKGCSMNSKMMDFGNYLLSEERKELIFSHPDKSIEAKEEALKTVSHADFENFMKKIKKE